MKVETTVYFSLGVMCLAGPFLGTSTAESWRVLQVDMGGGDPFSLNVLGWVTFSNEKKLMRFNTEADQKA